MGTEVDWGTVSRGGYDEFRQMRQRQLDLMRFDSELLALAQLSDLRHPVPVESSNEADEQAGG